MTMMARTLLDEWKEEKYLRHYTIAHVLGTINWRWFEREGERQRIKQIIKYCLWQHIKKRSRERERFAVSNVPIVSSNVFARAKMYWIRSTPWSYITCSLINSLSPFSSFSFFLPLSLILFFSFDLAQNVNITKLLRKKMNAQFHMIKSKELIKIILTRENKQTQIMFFFLFFLFLTTSFVRFLLLIIVTTTITNNYLKWEAYWPDKIDEYCYNHMRLFERK
jgi:hypothetical protein